MNTASSMLCVTISTDLIGMRPCVHRSSRSVRSVSAVSTSSAENGSSISRIVGSTTSARAKPTRWHAARQLARVRVLEAVETDQVDRGQRRSRRSRAPTPSASRPASTFCSTVSHGNSAKVWNTIATPSAGRAAAGRDSHFTAGRLDQPGDDAQQRRLARAGTAEQPDDLAFAQRQVRIVEHEQFALRLVEAAVHVLDAQDFVAEARRLQRLGRLGGALITVEFCIALTLNRDGAGIPHRRTSDATTDG